MRVGRRSLSAGLLLAHLAGAALAFRALAEAWRFRFLLEILWERVPVLGHIPALFVVLPLLVATIGVAVGYAVRVARRIWRRQDDDDAALKWRAFFYLAVACVLFNVFVLSTPESFSGPFRVRFPVVADISAALAYGVYAVWLARLPKLRTRFSARTRRAIDVFAMNAVIALVLIELSVRVLARVWASPLLVTSASPSQIRRDSERRQPGSLLFGFPINQGGHYDTEFLPRSQRRRKTIVGIGDSFSYGVVPHAFHFTTVAERAGNGFEIYNMGYPGLGPIDYLYLLQSAALPLQPDLVLVHIFVGNDIDDGGMPGGPTRWHDADRYLSAVVLYRLQMMRRAKKADITRGVEAGTQDSASLVRQYPWLTNPMREPASMSRDVYLQLSVPRAVITKPAWNGYTPFLQALATMVSVARDVPIGFMLIPDEFQVEDSLWAPIVHLSRDSLDRDRPQRIVDEWARRMDIPVLDLLPALRAVPPLADGRRHVYHLQDTHFNARGNAAAGHALAKFIDSLLATPRRPRHPITEVITAPTRPPPRAALPLRVDFGDSTMRPWMRGWHPAEPSGGRTLSWSDGPRSVITTALPTGANIRMTFEVLPFEYSGSAPQRLRIVVNGSEVTQLPLQSGLNQYEVTLPAGALQKSPQTIEFSYAWTKRPADVMRGGTDVRDLAVAWYSLAFVAP